MLFDFPGQVIYHMLILFHSDILREQVYHLFPFECSKQVWSPTNHLQWPKRGQSSQPCQNIYQFKYVNRDENAFLWVSGSAQTYISFSSQSLSNHSSCCIDGVALAKDTQPVFWVLNIHFVDKLFPALSERGGHSVNTQRTATQLRSIFPSFSSLFWFYSSQLLPAPLPLPVGSPITKRQHI